MTSYAVSADGTRIAYEAEGTAKPLIVIGGALNDRNSPAAYVPLLQDAFTVVRYDRRGRGDSDAGTPWAAEREVEDLRALVDACGGEAYLYGHSSGAVLGLRALAEGLPALGMVSYEPPFLTGGGEDWQAFAEEQRRLAASGRPGDAVENFIRHAGAPWNPQMRQMPFWPAMEALGHTVYYDLTIVGDGSVPTEALAGVAVPVLSLYGGASPAWAEASAHAVADALPDARSEAVPGQTHNVAADKVAPILREFLLG
ncbi:alpha/beta fold hydrolase [Arthrobacter sp. NPDC090010]|uniref:alpha/beta fold hydrolase n=1 Tax=Arthrobacter sp. NPDC090010 TaxID=3363942 RepID=UPI0037F9087D